MKNEKKNPIKRVDKKRTNTEETAVESWKTLHRLESFPAEETVSSTTTGGHLGGTNRKRVTWRPPRLIRPNDGRAICWTSPKPTKPDDDVIMQMRKVPLQNLNGQSLTVDSLSRASIWPMWMELEMEMATLSFFFCLNSFDRSEGVEENRWTESGWN